jgi:hypothetical protein
LLFSLFMALGSLGQFAAMDVAAAPGELTDLAGSALQVTGTSSLEVDVVRCPEGFDPNDLFGTCTASGIDGVTVEVTSVDPALGIDLSEVTDAPDGGGPGRTTFPDLPAGEFAVSIGLTPEAGVRYYMYCGVAGGGQPLPANPDDALDTIVTVADATDVGCDLYVIPTESTPPADPSTIDLWAFTCLDSALPEGDSLDFADYQGACTDPAPNVDFHVVQGSDDTLQVTDSQGRTQFEFPSGVETRFYSGVPLEANEVLFCAVNNGEAEEVTIDETGVSTFPNATAEDRTCSWFLIDEAPATEAPTEAPTELPTEQPTDEPTEQPTEEPTEIPTDVPTEEPVEDSTISLTAFTCDFDAVENPGAATFSEFQAACGDVAPGVDFHMNTGELGDVQTTGGNGQVNFSFPTGEQVDFYAAVPLEADEYLFCSVGGDASAVPMDDQGVAHFENTATTAQTCSWFLIDEAPATEAPTEEPTEQPTEQPTDVPTEQPTELPTEQPTEDLPGGDGDDLGQISVFAMVCPEGFDPEEMGVDYDTLSANCGTGVEDVSFTFGYPNGNSDIRVSDGQNPIVFSALQPGDYTLYSSVPLEAAQEYSFCTSDGGNRYEREFNSQGVTAFEDMASEQIDCEWYIVPINQRGDETGGSLEIHLSTCPVNFDGNNIFDTCHSNGLAGYEFVLDGPDGEQTASTVIQQQDGPGVVAFTSLAPGEYEFRGGPPGDFGTVELFCSTQPDSGTPEYSLDDFVGSVTLGENEHVLCDWYFLPEDASGQTPTPTPTEEPSRAEILVTLYACPADANLAGSGQGKFEESCTEKVNDVTFKIGDPNSAPLSAKTGASGEGAVRFFDLLPGDLTMTPSLPSDLKSAAVFCTIDDGTPYQKALSNGGTTFVDVDGESIECSWFASRQAEQPPEGPTGSITVREYLCEKDRSEITDWDAECKPGSTGTSYTIANTATGTTADGTPGEDGIYVFRGLANGFYTLKQNDGTWCRAVADRVDSQSRVIVEGGGNTDVVLYQCNAVEGLPTTGSGPAGTITSGVEGVSRLQMLSIALMVIAVPLAVAAVLQARWSHRVAASIPDDPGQLAGPTIHPDGRITMRFR